MIPGRASSSCVRRQCGRIDVDQGQMTASTSQFIRERPPETPFSISEFGIREKRRRVACSGAHVLIIQTERVNPRHIERRETYLPNFRWTIS
jgi:hypothetical protein